MSDIHKLTKFRSMGGFDANLEKITRLAPGVDPQDATNLSQVEILIDNIELFDPPNYSPVIFGSNSPDTTTNKVIAIGVGSSSTDGIALGNNAVAVVDAVVVGHNSSAGQHGVAVGSNSQAGDYTVAIGSSTNATDDTPLDISFGTGATAGGLRIQTETPGDVSTRYIEFEQSPGELHKIPTVDSTSAIPGYIVSYKSESDGFELIPNYVGITDDSIKDRDPNTSDDYNNGYAANQLWFNYQTGRLFVCVSNTPNTAQWDLAGFNNLLSHHTVMGKGNTGVPSLSGTPTIVLGSNNTIGNPSGIIVGHSSISSSADAIIVGSNNTGASGISIGNTIDTAADNDTVVIGNRAESTGITESIIIGMKADADGDKVVAIGPEVNVSGSKNTVIGSGTSASGSEIIVIGHGSESLKSNSTVIGIESSSDGVNNIVIGDGSESDGDDNVILGRGVNLSGEYTIAIGDGIQDTFDNNVLIGRNVQGVTGQSAVAIGHDVSGTGEQSVAIGANSAAVYPRNVAIGPGAETSTTTPMEMVFGTDIGGSIASVRVNRSTANDPQTSRIQFTKNKNIAVPSSTVWEQVVSLVLNSGQDDKAVVVNPSSDGFILKEFQDPIIGNNNEFVSFNNNGDIVTRVLHGGDVGIPGGGSGVDLIGWDSTSDGWTNEKVSVNPIGSTLLKRTSNGQALVSNAVETNAAVNLGQMNFALSSKADIGMDGKIPSSQIPAMAITDVFVVNSELEMLGLDAQTGDIARRLDTGQTFVHNGGTAGDASDWTEITTISDVTSVNTFQGDVVLDYTHVGAAPTVHAHTLSDITDAGSWAARNSIVGSDVGISGSTDAIAPVWNGTNNSWNNGYQVASTGTTANTIVLRGTSGRITVGTPSSNSHATTKKYVDDELALKQDNLPMGSSNDFIGLNATGDDFVSRKIVPSDIGMASPSSNNWSISVRKGSTDSFSSVNVTANTAADTVALRGLNGTLNVGVPTSNSHATTKLYVDTEINNTVSSLGDMAFKDDIIGQDVGITAVTGSIIPIWDAAGDKWTVNGNAVQESLSNSTIPIRTSAGALFVDTPTSNNHATTKKYVDDGLNLKADDNTVVKLTGAQTIAGEKTFSSYPVLPSTTPSASRHATTKSYVDGEINTRVKLAGDTMTGRLTNSADFVRSSPSSTNEAKSVAIMAGSGASNEVSLGAYFGGTGGEVSYGYITVGDVSSPLTSIKLDKNGKVGVMIPGNTLPTETMDVNGSMRVRGLSTGIVKSSSTGVLSSSSLLDTDIPNISAAKLTSGELPDARLSSKVVMTDTAQTISGSKTFSNANTVFSSSAATIRKNNATGTLYMSGGSSNTNGANIRLAGASHASDKAGNLRWDSSIKMTWNTSGVTVPSGSTLTVPTPSSDYHASTKKYVDEAILVGTTGITWTTLPGKPEFFPTDDTVKLSGDQTVAGEKTFSTIPVLPSSNPSSDNQAVRKKYVDDEILAAVAMWAP